MKLKNYKTKGKNALTVLLVFMALLTSITTIQLAYPAKRTTVTGISVEVNPPSSGEQFHIVTVSGTSFPNDRTVLIYMDGEEGDDLLGTTTAVIKGRLVFTFPMPWGSPGPHNVTVKYWEPAGSITQSQSQSTTIGTGTWITFEETFLLPVTTPLDDRLTGILDGIGISLVSVSTSLGSLNAFLALAMTSLAQSLTEIQDTLAALFVDTGFFGDHDDDGIENFRDPDVLWSLITVRNDIYTMLKGEIEDSEDSIRDTLAEMTTLYGTTATASIDEAGYHKISIHCTEGYEVKAVYVEVTDNSLPAFDYTNAYVDIDWGITRLISWDDDPYPIPVEGQPHTTLSNCRFEYLTAVGAYLNPTALGGQEIEIRFNAQDGDFDGTEYVSVQIILETARQADYYTTIEHN